MIPTLPPCDQFAEPGVLYLVGTPIGNLGDLSLRAVNILSSCDLIACEDTRVSRKLLGILGIQKPLLAYHDANEKDQAEVLLNQLREGKSVAVISDAGMPGISDPGFRIVRACRKAEISVVPIPGPNAAVTALAASGLPTDSFLFAGFLPPKASARVNFFEKYRDFPHSLVLYESSHRIDKFMNDLKETLGAGRIMALGREITKRHETFLVGSVGDVKEKFDKQSKKGEFTVIIAPADYIL